MPPRGRGGGDGKRAPPPPRPSFTDADVSAFRAVTGADDAQAVRALRSSGGSVEDAVNRHLDIHSHGGRSLPGTSSGTTEHARRQANMHEALDSCGGGSASPAPAPAKMAAAGVEEGAAADVSMDVASSSLGLHGALWKRKRADEATEVAPPAAAAADAVASPFDASLVPRRPTPDAEGWLVSMPQELEAEAETREATVEWATNILAPPAAGWGFDTTAAAATQHFEDASFPPCASSIDGRGRAGTNGGGGNGGGGDDVAEVPRCICKTPAKLCTVHKDGPNQGRFFYGCAGYSAAARCGFFKWADDAPSSEASRAMRWRRFTPPRFKLVSQTHSRSHAAAAAAAAASSAVFRPCDVRQGAVGDCWLLSALAVVAERPDLVARVVGPSLKYDSLPAASARGAFLLRLFLGGRWRAVVVDPNLPVSGRSTEVLRGANEKKSRGGGGGDEFALAYSRAADNQLWVPLVEKAYAKAHGGGGRRGGW